MTQSAANQSLGAEFPAEQGICREFIDFGGIGIVFPGKKPFGSAGFLRKFPGEPSREFF
jgi:hypothetical protein